MRIPRYDRQYDAPRSPLHQISPEEASAGYGALARGAERAGAAVREGVDAVLRVHDENQKAKDLIEALQLRTEFSTGLADIDVTLRENYNYETHAQELQTRGEALRDQLVKRANNPRVAEKLQIDSAQVLSERVTHAKYDSIKYAKDVGAAKLVSFLDTTAHEAANADATERGRVLYQAELAIDAAVKRDFIKPHEAEPLKKKLREDTASVIARREIERDPEKARAELIGSEDRAPVKPGEKPTAPGEKPATPSEQQKSIYDHLPEGKRQGFIEAADRAIDRQRTRALQEQDRADRAMAKWVEDTKAQTKAMFDEKLRNGQLDMAQVQLAQELNLITSHERQYYEKSIQGRDEGGGPGNPAVIRRFRQDVYNIDKDPEKTAAELRQAISDGKVPSDDRSQGWLSHLETRIEKKRKEGVDKEQDHANRRHSEAKSLIDKLFQVTGPMEKLVPDAHGAMQSMQEDLARVSTAMGGKEDPLAWYFKNYREYVARAQSAAGNKIFAERRGMLRQDYKSIDDIVANKSAYEKEPPGRFLSDLRRMRDILDIEQRMVVLNGYIISTGAGQQGGANAAPTAPAGPLRPGQRR